MASEIIRIPPYKYIHVLDGNKNVTRLETGPQNFIKQDHEKIVSGKQPVAMVSINPFSFCAINDPVQRDEAGALIFDKHGQVKLKHGDSEIRTSLEIKEPFPLYPGETLVRTDKLPTIPRDCAFKLEAIRDFEDEDKTKRVAGDEWLVFGPKLYFPRVDVRFVKVIKPHIVHSNEALRVKATKECKDVEGNDRKAGEEWLIRKPGFYLPGIDEEVCQTLPAEIIDGTTALHVAALQTFVDVYGKERKAGEEWLITVETTSMHIPDVYERIVNRVNITILTDQEFCYILNPVDADGNNQLGKKILVRGPLSFFLKPGEEFDGGVQSIHCLQEDEALLLRALEDHTDAEGNKRMAGDKWMIYGPCRYIPPVEVELIEKRYSIPLDKNEGIYVRDTRTGSVRSIKGQTYMLKAHEEMWEMNLNETVEQLLSSEGQKLDKMKLVTFKCPFNGAVQVYNYKSKESRVVFGPDLVMLEPDEQFTISYLSGGKPKRPGVIKTLFINLGPDFFTDIFTVETSDHARLKLQLSYNWFFDTQNLDKKDASKIFNVRDFVGDACSAIASKVRGAVASISFENFHKYSAKTIRQAIFGMDERGKIIDRFEFHSNNLVVTNVDIKMVEPVEAKTKESLQRSVTLAIEITTRMQEAEAKRQADKIEQEAKGALEKQKIEDEANAEKERKELYDLKTKCESIKSTGQAIAEASARSEAARIEAEAEVTLSEYRAKAQKIKEGGNIEYLKKKNEIELDKAKKLHELEINKARDLADIESKKFEGIVGAIGKETLVDIANSGPELQAKLLQSLGLSGYLMMDSNNPINLFNTAQGMINMNPLGSAEQK